MANHISNDELMHYGVLGMKWGRRKANPVSSAKSAQKQKNRASNKKLISQTERYAAKQSTGKNIAKQFLLGSGGTTTYNMARSMGYSRGKSAVRALLDINASSIFGAAAGTSVNAAQLSRNQKKYGVNNLSSTQRLAGMAVQRGAEYGADSAFRKSGRASSLQQRRMMKEYRSRGH